MKLLFVQLTNECNLHCGYCSFKKYLKPQGVAGRNRSPSEILQWIKDNCTPDEWIPFITGAGEPTVYPQFNLIVDGLGYYGYNVVVQSNGIIPIAKRCFLHRVITWHTDDIPKEFDKIIILKTGNWKFKEEYCKSNNIPYITRQLVDHTQDSNRRICDRYPTSTNKYFKKSWAILPSGEMIPCYRRKSRPHTKIWLQDGDKLDLSYPLCSNCPYVYDVERLLSDNLIEFCNEYYRKQKQKGGDIGVF